MEILNIKIEMKLNDYLYQRGEITKTEYESARIALINRLTETVPDVKIEYISIEGKADHEIT